MAGEGGGGGVQRTVKEKEAEEFCVCVMLVGGGWGGFAQDAVTLKGVNADWAKAHQRLHVRTHSLQRAQTGFTADNGILLQTSPSFSALSIFPPLPSSHLLLCHPVFAE